MKRIINFTFLLLLFIALFSFGVVAQNDVDCNGSLRCTFIKAQVTNNPDVCDSLTNYSGACKSAVAKLNNAVDKKVSIDDAVIAENKSGFASEVIVWIFVILIILLLGYFVYRYIHENKK